MDQNVVCSTAQHITDALAMGRDTKQLFGAAGIDSETAVHIAEHAMQFKADLDPASFGWGLLFGIQLMGELHPPTLSDQDLNELRNG